MRLPRILGRHPRNSPLLVRLDCLLSCLFAWNTVYHARTTIQKFRPEIVVYRLGKQRP